MKLKHKWIIDGGLKYELVAPIGTAFVDWNGEVYKYCKPNINSDKFYLIGILLIYLAVCPDDVMTLDRLRKYIVTRFSRGLDFKYHTVDHKKYLDCQSYLDDVADSKEIGKIRLKVNNGITRKPVFKLLFRISFDYLAEKFRIRV